MARFRNEVESPDPADQALWQAYRAAGGERPLAPIPLDANLVAAYLDGRASPAGVEQVEEAMFRDPELVETIQALRDLPSAAAGLPKNVTYLRTMGWWQMAAAAAALVVVSPLGFHLGQTSSVGTAASEAVAISEMAGDDDATFLDPGLAIANPKFQRQSKPLIRLIL